jgi:DNA-binding transcriptional LysR family regulator
MPLPDFDVLVAILDAGSMTGAAKNLGMARATLTRKLARLEEEVGAVLIHRTTRQLSATEAGNEMYRHARPIVDAVDAARASVRALDGIPRGLLRVTLPPGPPGGFRGLISTYMKAYPEVRVEVIAVTRHVDLVREGVDVGLRAGSLTGSSLISKRLFGTTVVAVASPSYLLARGTPMNAAELVTHDCLVSFERGEVPVRAWPVHNGGTVALTPRLASNDLSLLTQGALDGLGIALLPKEFLGTAIENGHLVPILEDELGFPTGIWVVYPEKRLMLPRVRAFIDMLVDWTEPLGLPMVASS